MIVHPNHPLTFGDWIPRVVLFVVLLIYFGVKTKFWGRFMVILLMEEILYHPTGVVKCKSVIGSVDREGVEKCKSVIGSVDM